MNNIEQGITYGLSNPEIAQLTMHEIGTGHLMDSTNFILARIVRKIERIEEIICCMTCPERLGRDHLLLTAFECSSDDFDQGYDLSSVFVSIPDFDYNPIDIKLIRMHIGDVIYKVDLMQQHYNPQE